MLRNGPRKRHRACAGQVAVPLLMAALVFCTGGKGVPNGTSNAVQEAEEILIAHFGAPLVTVRPVAESPSDEVMQMKAWTDFNPAPQWPPFETLTGAPRQPNHLVHGHFRSEANKVIHDRSDALASAYSSPPENSDEMSNAVYLPAVFNNLRCRTRPTLINPPDGSNLDTLLPAFTWDCHSEPDVTYAVLEIARDPDFSQWRTQTWFGPAQGVIKDWRLTRNFDPATTYYWRAWLQCGEVRGPYSEAWSFITGSGGTLLPAPPLVAPANGSTTTSTTVTLQWSPVDGAIEYVLRFRPAGTG